MATNRLDLTLLDSRLKTSCIGKSKELNELWDSIDSTNKRAIELARAGTPAGVIVIARQQTAGRGRLGRTWESPANAGLYVSFLLRPACSREDIPLYTLALGVAAAQAILICTGVQVGLKWVNDLVVEGKKLGGILAEMVSMVDNNPPALVLGIGINVDFTAIPLPTELEGHIEWLTRLVTKPIDTNQLIAELALQLEEHSNLIESGRKEAVLNSWRRHSATLGKQVRVLSANGNKEGTAIDINEDGALIVQTTGGERLTLHAGEITIRNLDGTYS